MIVGCESEYSGLLYDDDWEESWSRFVVFSSDVRVHAVVCVRSRNPSALVEITSKLRPGSRITVAEDTRQPLTAIMPVKVSCPAPVNGILYDLTQSLIPLTAQRKLRSSKQLYPQS
jgi:hypothetical protein